MTTIHRSLLLFAAGLLISLALSGCYTRIATVEDREPEYAQEEEEYVVQEGEVEDSTYDDRGRYWDDEMRWRYNMGFRYYYPWHTSYRYGYYDPWYYDHIYYPWSIYDPWNWYYNPYAYRYSIYGPYGSYYSRYSGYYGLGYYPYAQPVIYYGMGEGSGFSTRNSGYSRTGDVRSNPRSSGASTSPGTALPPATRSGVSRDGGPARSSGSTGVERRGSSGSSRESSVGRSSRGTSSGREGVSSQGRSSGSSGRSSGSGSSGRSGSSGGSGNSRSSGGSRGGGGDSSGSSNVQQSYTPAPPATAGPSAQPSSAPAAPASSGGENSRRSGATREN